MRNIWSSLLLGLSLLIMSPHLSAEENGPYRQLGGNIVEPTGLPYCDTCTLNRDRSSYRHDNYGTSVGYPIPLRFHADNRPLDPDDLRATIMATVLRLKNIDYCPGVEELLFETILVNSRLGQSEISVRDSHLFIGISQIRYDYAATTFSWLLFNRLDIYNAIVKSIPQQHDLYWGMRYSIPTNIAIAVQYYWLVCPDLRENTQDIHQRAALWTACFAPPSLTEFEAKFYYQYVVGRYRERGIEPGVYPTSLLKAIKDIRGIEFYSSRVED